jgi:5'-3' exoribonuclease 1
MNGIIHSMCFGASSRVHLIADCSHPDDNVVNALSEEEIMVNIFKYIEIIVAIVKPQKLLYLAIDGIIRLLSSSFRISRVGVAPRAKMNQQRARRFRTAKEAAAKIEELKSQGKAVPEQVFDSNCITPGTAFMVRLSQQLDFFIVKKKCDDQLWQSINVIYSGHEVCCCEIY